jgi:2-polyprenyl-6-methoxyphenol hydroxylase-like FAD-dependent oxidoreductase
MRIVISGAGAVGKHLAADLTNRGHEVTLIEQHPSTLEEAQEWAPTARSCWGRVRALGAGEGGPAFADVSSP